MSLEQEILQPGLRPRTGISSECREGLLGPEGRSGEWRGACETEGNAVGETRS